MKRFFLVGFALHALSMAPSQATADDAPPHEVERTLSVQGFVGPLEDFPRGGIGLHFGWQISERLRLGPQLTWYVPRAYGNVRRHLVDAGLALGVDILRSSSLTWAFDTGLSLGAFVDDYQRVYDDVVRIAPGIHLGTSLELRVWPRVRPYVGVRLAAYFADSVTDTQWIEGFFGIRAVIGR